MQNYDDYLAPLAEAMDEDYALADPRENAERTLRYSNALYTAAARRELDEVLMARILEAYTADFGDRAAELVSPLLPRWPVRAIRQGEALVITDPGGDGRLVPGDRVMAADGVPIPDYARRVRRRLTSEDPARECWDTALARAEELTLERDGGRFVLRPFAVPLEPGPAVTLSREGGCVLLRIRRLDDPGAIRSGSARCRGAERVIVDLRGCGEGEGSALLPLYELLAGEETELVTPEPGETVRTNYSPRNCARLLALLAPLEEREDETGAAARDHAARIRSLSGRGLLSDASSAERRRIAPACGTAALLTDGYTGSVCRRLLRFASGCALTAGRTPMAGRGTFRALTVPLSPTLRLRLPVSVTDAEDCPAPALQIPWSPEELRRDAVLEAALEAL